MSDFDKIWHGVYLWRVVLYAECGGFVCFFHLSWTTSNIFLGPIYKSRMDDKAWIVTPQLINSVADPYSLQICFLYYHLRACLVCSLKHHSEISQFTLFLISSGGPPFFGLIPKMKKESFNSTCAFLTYFRTGYLFLCNEFLLFKHGYTHNLIKNRPKSSFSAHVSI